MSDDREPTSHPNDDADIVSWRKITTGMPVIAADGTQHGSLPTPRWLARAESLRTKLTASAEAQWAGVAIKPRLELGRSSE